MRAWSSTDRIRIGAASLLMIGLCAFPGEPAELRTARRSFRVRVRRGYGELDLRAGIGRGPDGEPAAHQLRTLPHPAQTDVSRAPLRRPGLRPHAPAIVTHA